MGWLPAAVSNESQLDINYVPPYTPSSQRQLLTPPIIDSAPEASKGKKEAQVQSIGPPQAYSRTTKNPRR